MDKHHLRLASTKGDPLTLNISGMSSDEETDSASIKFHLTTFSMTNIKAGFSSTFGIEAARQLYNHLGSIDAVSDPSVSKVGRIVEISDETVPKLVLEALKSDPETIRALVADNLDLVKTLINLNIKETELLSLGYRKDRLGRFQRMLTDPDYFAEMKGEYETDSTEGVWQRFFEENSWIFGRGLTYLFTEALDGRKLETMVAGHDVTGPGKRVDGLVKTRGLIQSLCFVEIKHHLTNLIDHTSAYRKGCWRVSQELAGTIGQVQGTVELAMQRIGTRLEPKKDGTPTGEVIYGYKPRAFVVAGTLAEFANEDGLLNEDKFRSFELFRRSILSPEIITFDELLARAQMTTLTPD